MRKRKPDVAFQRSPAQEAEPSSTEVSSPAYVANIIARVPDESEKRRSAG